MLPQRTEEDMDAPMSVDELTPTTLEGRRLGLRVATTFSVLVTRNGQRTRARAAELSTTGIVLDFRHSPPCSFDGLVTLDLMLPGFARPVHAAARHVRNVRKLVAFEFMIIGRDDRLSIAEYIDRVRSAKS